MRDRISTHALAKRVFIMKARKYAKVLIWWKNYER